MRWLAGIAGVGLILLAAWHWGVDRNAAPGPQETAQDPVVAAEPAAPLIEDALEPQAVGHRPGVSPAVPAAAPSPTPSPPAERPRVSESLFELANQSRQRVADWTFDDYRQLTSDPDAMSGESAFSAYQFARLCANGITTESELLLRREQFNNYYQQNQNRVSERRLKRAMEQLESSLVHCQGMGDQVLDLAMDWLLLAAELDYLPAVTSFADEVPRLLAEDNWAVFRRPDLLELYRLRAPEFLNRALETGHPDAFRAHARALRDGLAMDADPIAAQAMELAAQAADGDALPLHSSNPELSEEQNRFALSQAEELCLRYCRQ